MLLLTVSELTCQVNVSCINLLMCRHLEQYRLKKLIASQLMKYHLQIRCQRSFSTLLSFRFQSIPMKRLVRLFYLDSLLSLFSGNDYHWRLNLWLCSCLYFVQLFIPHGDSTHYRFLLWKMEIRDQKFSMRFTILRIVF